MKEILITSSVLIVVILLVRKLFRGKVSQKLIYAAWLLVALRLLVPIQFGQSQYSVTTFTEKIENQSKPIQQVQEVLQEPVAGPSRAELYEQLLDEYLQQSADPDLPEVYSPITPEIQEQIEEQVDQQITAPTLSEVLTAVWIIGMGVMAVWFITANLLYLYKAKQGAVPFAACEAPVAVRVSSNVPTPCLVGFFRPVIYLTPASTENAQALNHVLTHELAHLRHWDHIWSFLRCVCLCVYWFDPLVWIAAHQSRRDCELACDESALKKLGDEERIAYGQTLLATVTQSMSPAHLIETATAMNETKKQLKERVNFIVKKPENLLIAAICLILVAAITAGCAFAGSKPTESSGMSTSETEPSGSSVSTDPTGATEPAITDSQLHYPTELLDGTIYPLPENPTVENLVITAVDTEVTAANGNLISVRLPWILPISEGVLQTDRSLLDAVQAVIDGNGGQTRAFDYEAWLNGNLLSIVISVADTNGSINYTAFNLDITTGYYVTAHEMVQRYLDISWPQFLMATNDLIIDQFTQRAAGVVDADTITEITSDIPTDTVAMYVRQLYIGDNGQLMLIYMGSYWRDTLDLNKKTICAFNPTTIETIDTAYRWLFGLHHQTDGITADGYSTLLVDCLFYDPEVFIAHMSKLDGSEVDALAGHMLYDISPDELESYSTLLQTLHEQVTTEAEKETVQRLYHVISDYYPHEEASGTYFSITEERPFEFSYRIFNAQGQIVREEQTGSIYPKITMDLHGLLEIQIAHGTGIISSTYYDVEQDRFSEEFCYVAATSGNTIVYLDGPLDNRSLIIGDIFDRSKIYYQVILDCEEDISPITRVRISSSRNKTQFIITYRSSENGSEKSITFDLTD